MIKTNDLGGILAFENNEWTNVIGLTGDVIIQNKCMPTPRIDIDHRGETVIGTMSEGITPYKFVVLLKHFADKAVELGYWLELDVT